MVAHQREGGGSSSSISEKWAGSVVELAALSVSGVSSGKRRFVAEIGLKVRRKESMGYMLGPGVSGVRPVVNGGGMVANRRRGDEKTPLCRAGVVWWCFSKFTVRFVSGPNGWITHGPCY